MAEEAEGEGVEDLDEMSRQRKSNSTPTIAPYPTTVAEVAVSSRQQSPSLLDEQRYHYTRCGIPSGCGHWVTVCNTTRVTPVDVGIILLGLSRAYSGVHRAV